jgi:uncharacterized phosphosugar-binding protein
MNQNLYKDKIIELIEKANQKNEKMINQIANLMVEKIEQGGLVYVFGAGHSSLLVEEAFHRAGGLIPVYPVLYDFLSPHTKPKFAGQMERLEGLAKIIFDSIKITSSDLLFLASNSGINSVAIELATLAKQNGITTIAFTSLEHSKSVESRHSSKLKLYECVSYVLDTQSPVGDACVDFGDTKVAASSTILNSFLWHSLLVKACEIWKSKGKKLPIYKSANLAGGDAYNESIEKNYKSRIPLL